MLLVAHVPISNLLVEDFFGRFRDLRHIRALLLPHDFEFLPSARNGFGNPGPRLRVYRGCGLSGRVR